VPDNDAVSAATTRQVSYHDADAQPLTGQVQQEYIHRYGGPDGSPMDRGEFSPPNCHFLVRYDDGRPVAMGGWRVSESARAELQLDGPVAELKRMYVVPASRGRGHARGVLRDLEQTAAAAGAEWIVLETGMMQPEAVALYQSSGFEPVAAFGHYADSPHSIHLGKRLGPIG